MNPRPHDRLRAGLFQAMRTAFRLLPLSTATRDRWRNWFVDHLSVLLPDRTHSPLLAETSRLGHPARADHPAIGHVPWRAAPLPSHGR